ncbi:hypothetical protein BS78_04G285500 [Paspalum vaginatum]|nr:hypothetical protein BS78_04G285500 [Paspalum vaginatum]KAJ1281141.1 hypothetical protein BS78_04G285500 [Paspalum vaginatum]
MLREGNGAPELLLSLRLRAPYIALLTPRGPRTLAEKAASDRSPGAEAHRPRPTSTLRQPRSLQRPATICRPYHGPPSPPSSSPSWQRPPSPPRPRRPAPHPSLPQLWLLLPPRRPRPHRPRWPRPQRQRSLPPPRPAPRLRRSTSARPRRGRRWPDLLLRPGRARRQRAQRRLRSVLPASWRWQRLSLPSHCAPSEFGVEDDEQAEHMEPCRFSLFGRAAGVFLVVCNKLPPLFWASRLIWLL